jgi:hypothetical protein
MKIRSVGAELFYADKKTRTDMTKLIVVFSKFCESALQGTKIHALSWMCTRIPSNLAAQEQPLRPHGHRDRRQ